uniref:Serine/threonine-protein phosphatase 6 regulatory ankyrin repeat subunit C n=2 Tax=Lygus hesperus TaxID=30085 RepID=A0A146L4K0_LYGHE
MIIPKTISAFAAADSLNDSFQYRKQNTMKIKVEPEDGEPRNAVEDYSHRLLPVLEFSNLSLNEKDDESEDENTTTEEAKPNIQEKFDDDEEIDPDKLIGKGPMKQRTNSSRVQIEPYPHVLQQPTTIINERQMTGYHVSEAVIFVGNENEIPLSVTEMAQHQTPSPIFDNLPPEPELNLDTLAELEHDLKTLEFEPDLTEFTPDDVEKLLNISCFGDFDVPNNVFDSKNVASNYSDTAFSDDPNSPDSAYGSVFSNSPQSSYTAPEFSPTYENHVDQGLTNFNDEFLTQQQFYDGRSWSSDQPLPTPIVKTVKMNIPQVVDPKNNKAQGSRKPTKENLPTLKPSGPCKPTNRVTTDKSLRDRLVSKMRPERKVAVWYSTIRESDEKFIEKNEQGQTSLMKDLLLEPRVPGIIEAVYERIGRIKRGQLADFLCHRDMNGHCALYQAATLHSDIPEIAAYIAETYASLGCDVNKPYKSGNTILHYLAQLGDKFDSVLDELLRVTVNGERVFRIDQQNDAGHTPLHVATLHHMTSYAGSTFGIASTLIKHRSSVSIQNSAGATPLHVAATSKACDPEYFRKLLEQRGAENMQDKEGNTPLHLVALSVTLPNVGKLKKVIHHLITSKARMDLMNKEGKRPLDCLHPLCKEVILKEIQPKRQ